MRRCWATRQVIQCTRIHVLVHRMQSIRMICTAERSITEWNGLEKQAGEPNCRKQLSNNNLLLRNKVPRSFFSPSFLGFASSLSRCCCLVGTSADADFHFIGVCRGDATKQKCQLFSNISCLAAVVRLRCRRRRLAVSLFLMFLVWMSDIDSSLRCIAYRPPP